MDDVTIRAVTDIATLRAVEDLQQRIWGMDDRGIVPAHQLLAAVAAGGILLGAFAREGTLIGFCYGFVGRRERRPFFYSHMTGVAEGWRGQEVGLRLKRAQREAVLAQGLDWIVWTFDPLQAANAYFNFRRLGGEARRYHINYYGEMTDALNRGIESDRLEVDWFLQSRRAVESLADRPAEDAPNPPVALAGAGSPPRPTDPVLDLVAPQVRLSIPADFAALRHQDIGLARAWRAASRRTFLAYLPRGYAAVDFVRGEGLGDYVLRSDDAR